MNEILKKKIEEAADCFITMYPKVGLDGVAASRKDAFSIGAEYALTHQWISVEEALPESEDWVIVMYDVGFMKVQKGIIVRLNRPFCESIKITHWMSIPKFETK